MRARAPSTGWLVEVFAAANLAFLGVDIGLAHAANSFARAEEWIPIGVSALCTVLLLPGLTSAARRERHVWIGIGVGAVSVLTGTAGMLYHLGSAFFAQQTLRGLVYTAPFVAPLAYVGVGLLLVLNRLEPWGTAEWRRWVLFLALGGWAGNLGLALLDHAQNGFFEREEWLAVGAAAFGTSFLGMAVLRPADRGLARACLVVLAAASAIGIAGFVFHVLANLEAAGRDLLAEMVHGAPPFAPLLFVDLAVLAALGLREVERGD